MAGVPDQAVAAEVEGQVQGQAQLDDAEVLAKWAGRLADAGCTARRASRRPAARAAASRQRRAGRAASRSWTAVRAASSAIPFQHVSGQGLQRSAARSQAAPAPRTASSTSCSARRRLSSTPASRERSACRGPASLPTRLPSVGLVPLHVEQVVDDLKRQAEPLAVGVQGRQLSARRPGRPCRPAAAQTRSMAPVLRRWIASSVSSPPAGNFGLPGRPPGRRPCRRRRPPRPASAQQRAATVGRLHVAGQHLEGQGQQGVAGQDGRRLAERLVAASAGRGAGRRRPSPAGRRGSASRCEPSRPHRPPAGPPRESQPQASAASNTSIGRSRLPGRAGYSGSPRRAKGRWLRQRGMPIKHLVDAYAANDG